MYVGERAQAGKMRAKMWLRLKSGLRPPPWKVLKHEHCHKVILLCVRSQGSCVSQSVGYFQVPFSGGQFPGGGSSHVSRRHTLGALVRHPEVLPQSCVLVERTRVDCSVENNISCLLGDSGRRPGTVSSAFHRHKLSVSPQRPCEAGTPGETDFRQGEATCPRHTARR